MPPTVRAAAVVAAPKENKARVVRKVLAGLLVLVARKVLLVQLARQVRRGRKDLPA